MPFPKFVAVAVAGLALVAPAQAGPRPTFAAYIVDPSGKALGTATFVGVDTGGVQVRVDVTGLTPGLHGMHVHENGSCNALVDTTGKSTPFGAAGGHYDPKAAGHHLGPNALGHAGDLPNLDVDDAGHARTTFYDDRFSVTGPDSIVGRSIVVHANEDNYTDTPPNGGSGARVACGEIGALRS
jgi:Cu-Zn family superoxide dismutase